MLVNDYLGHREWRKASRESGQHEKHSKRRKIKVQTTLSLSSSSLLQKCTSLLLLQLLIASLRLMIEAHVLLPIEIDELLDIRQLIESRGFLLQRHQVQTDDGYVLTVDRAVTRDFDPTTYNLIRKPVVMFHGIITDTGYFYMNGPGGANRSSFRDNFGFGMLASGRYDLWIANARGNRYSRTHRRFSDSDPRFWRFSWDHIALHDVPAFLHYIRAATGHQKIAYIGYSQGCSTIMALLSMQPQYANIIQPLIMWAPAIYISRVRADFERPFARAFHALLVNNPRQWTLSNEMINPLLRIICRIGLPSKMCSLSVAAIFGESNSLNHTRIPVYFRHVPSSISSWQLAHYVQNALSRGFDRFDYGNAATNVAVYGRPTPPQWPLERIPASSGLKILVMHGTTDLMVNVTDALRFVRRLQANGHYVERRQITTWNHVDFLMGMGAGRRAYVPTIQFLDRYSTW